MIAVAICAGSGYVPGLAMTPSGLRCEYLDSGACVHTHVAPRLSWTLKSDDGRGLKQSAYRVIVASTPELLAADNGDLWDSGKVESPMMAQINYGGRQLGSFDNCYWKVMVWDHTGKPGVWSAQSAWQMGVLSEPDWHGAQWIARRDTESWQRRRQAIKTKEQQTAVLQWPVYNYKDLDLWTLYDSIGTEYDAAPLLRKPFRCNHKVKKATLYICGLGYFESWINGERVGCDVMNPAWTMYHDNPLYCAYDVTNMIRGGDNAIGVMLGRGPYSPICNDVWEQCKAPWVSQPKLIAMLRIEDTDGRIQTVVTDDSWRVADGPIVFDDTRIGEIYDARREQKGWTSAGFDDSAWRNVSEVEWNTAALSAQMLPPIRRKDAYKPIKRIDRDGGISVFDIGQNIAGWARVRVKGPRGSRVLVEYCEQPTDPELVADLHPARFDMSAKIADRHFGAFHDATTEVRQQNAYVLSGDGTEEFECHFSYKGFQYVRVTASDGVEVVGLEGVPVHSDLRSVGSFSCSDPVVNRLQQISQVTMLNNLMGLPTDCPHREKQGWTADSYFTSGAAMYNFDMAQFYTKWLRDLAGTQGPGGDLSTVAPSNYYTNGVSVSWPAAIVYVPSDMYEYYGDRRIVADMFPTMQRFAEHARTHEDPEQPGYVREVLGDWVAPAADSILPALRGSSLMGPPEGVIAYGSAAYYSILNRMQHLSELTNIGSKGYYNRWADSVKVNFNTAFFDTSSATYHGDTPTGYRMAPNIVALHEGLVPDSAVSNVELRLMQHLAATGYKMNAGFLGTRAMMKWLPEHDPEAAYMVATQPEFPGWGYMVAKGANTMWEDWAGCASLNHLPYCLISEYFYRYLAGIKLRHDIDGIPKIEISPTFVSSLEHVEASYDSMYGTIASRWQRDNGELLLDVEIPANCVASVKIPAESISCVYESGKTLQQSDGVVIDGFDGMTATLAIGSGSYSFRIKRH